MPLLDTDYTRLRQDMGFAANDTVNFPDTEIDDIFAEAAEDYTGRLVIKAQTRVIACQRIWMDAAKRHTYQQNHTLEKMEDVAKALKEATDYWVEQRKEAERNQSAVSNPGSRPASFTGRIVTGW